LAMSKPKVVIVPIMALSFDSAGDDYRRWVGEPSTTSKAEWRLWSRRRRKLPVFQHHLLICRSSSSLLKAGLDRVRCASMS
jgi:hypothetical protein